MRSFGSEGGLQRFKMSQGACVALDLWRCFEYSGKPACRDARLA